MRLLGTIALAVCATSGLTHPAMAQWNLTENGLGEQTANIGDDNGHGLAVNCGAGKLSIWYYTSSPDVRPLQPADTFLLFGFDGAASSLALPAAKRPLDSTMIVELAGLNAETVAGLIAAANRSISVDVGTASSAASGGQLDPATFSARGSTAAIASVKESCATPEVNWAGPALGLPLSKFKALKLEGNGAARVICTDDEDEGGAVAAVAEKMAIGGLDEGVVECGRYQPSGEAWERAASPIARVPMSASFTFAPLNSAREPELVRVFGIGKPADYGTVLRVLTGLYGESHHRDARMNDDGSLDEGASDSWYLGPYSFTLNENFLADGELTLNYYDRRFDE